MLLSNPFLILTLLSVLVELSASQPASCLIGSSDVAAPTFSPEPAPGTFYMDQINVAQCTGTISKIRYCYHNSPMLMNASLEARVSLYRRMGFFRFVRVSDVFVIRNNIRDQSGLVCENLNLETEVEVREQDMFGLCIPSSSENKVLPLFSESTDTNLMTTPCNSESVDRVRVFDLTTLTDTAFHVYADTSKTYV